MPKFTTTDGDEVYINSNNVSTTEQSQGNSGPLDFRNAEVTITTNDGNEIVVRGKIEDVNEKLGID